MPRSPRRPVGRPRGSTLLDAALIRRIAVSIRELLSERHTRRILGIPYATWRDWKKRGEKEERRRARGLEPRPTEEQFYLFSVTLKKAAAQGIQKQLQIIARAGTKTWQAAAWLLERTHGDDFSTAAFEYKVMKELEKFKRATADRVPNFRTPRCSA